LLSDAPPRTALTLGESASSSARAGTSGTTRANENA
jgi:hypothetical protein